MLSVRSKVTQNAAPARSPWLWIPSLYFAQGLPYVAVMTLSVVIYKRLGISNTDIAFYTSLLYLPWVIKPLWSPAVDIFKTKRQWIVSMQLAIAFALAGTGLALQSNSFFAASLAIFWIMAFASSTHDIAADGFYMLGLLPRDQAWWVGLRGTFYRLAMIVASGLLIMFAGTLEGRNGLASTDIAVCADAGVPTAVANPAAFTAPMSDGDLHLVCQPQSLSIRTGPANPAELDTTLTQARKWNLDHGFGSPPSRETKTSAGPIERFWNRSISQPLASFLRAHFPREKITRANASGNVGIVYFTLSKQPIHAVPVSFSAKPQGLARLGIGSAGSGFKVVEGERFVFTPENWNQPCMAVIQLDPKVSQAEALFAPRAGNIPLAWSITLFLMAGLFFAFCLWHAVILPRPAIDVPVVSGKNWVAEFLDTLGSFFKKPGIVPALAFILLYRFAEAQSVKLLVPFLLDAREAGGLGLSTGQVGFVYGTIGVATLTIGGLLGGFLSARYGFKKMLPIMVCAIHLPNLAFVYLSFAQPENLAVVNGSIALEQFGYGFGFTAYMLYLLHFVDGPHKTAHYAICTGLMALGMMLPGLFSGWLADIIGYRQFFVWVMLATIPGFLVAFTIKVEPRVQE